MQRVKILMGIPSTNIKIGGPITHLPYLVDYFNKNDNYEILTFFYGSKIDGGSLINKRDRVFCELINTQNKFLLILIRLFFLGARKVGVLSEIEKNEFIEKFGYSKKMVVVKNIVLPVRSNNVEGFNYFRRDPSKKYGLFVSRIVKGKGLNDLISALPQVIKTNPNFNLVVAGDGPEKITCSELAIRLGVDDSIIWLGFIPNNLMANLYLCSTVFIFPSHFPEGMPMALVEALKMGTPIVTTRVRFALNYLKDEENCLFINTGEIDDIVQKINLLIINSDLQMKMKSTNPHLIEKFSKEKVGKEFEIIYEEMIDR